MLPSQGLFRSIPCPFFLAGLCERPHCSYRHCRSDIRIDRKQDTETLDDPLSLEEEQEEVFPSKTAEGVPSRPPSSKDATAASPKKEPVASVNNKVSGSEKGVSCDASKSKRLKSGEVSPASSRKRSCDNEDIDGSSKRRKVSEKDSSEMGSVLGTLAGGVIGVVRSIQDSCLPKAVEAPEGTLRDIDELVREIESVGKPSKSPQSQSSSHHHKHKKNKHHKHRHRKESGSSSMSADSPTKDKRGSSSSHRKENKSKEEGLHKKEQDKDKKESRKEKESHSKRDEHKKKESSSSAKSSPSKDSKDSKSHGKAPSSPKKDKKLEESPSSVSRSKKERKPSGSSSGKGSSISSKEFSLSTSASVDVSNRFDALADGSGDDSPYTSDVYDDNSLNFEFGGGSDSDDDPDMVARQCLEMFENYKPEAPVKPVQKSTAEVAKKEDGATDGFSLVSKKRVAHANTLPKTPPSQVPQKKPAPVTSKNLQQTLFQRFEHQYGPRTNSQNGSSTTFTAPQPPAKPTGKARIAHVPNAGKLAQKPVIASGTAKTSSPTSNSAPGKPGALTYSQTAAKGVPREAHKPSASVISKPGPNAMLDVINKTSKIPIQARQTILNKLYAEFERILGDPSEAFEATIKREDELLARCTSKQVYYSSASSAVSGLRKSNKQDYERTSNSGRNVVSHQQMLTGSLESRNCSFRGAKKEIVIPEGPKLYQALLRYLMTEEQLQENGYPRPHPTGETGRVTAKPRSGDNATMTLTNRTCDRCKKRYKTTEDGEHVTPEVCNYHWSRKYSKMSKMGRGFREATYNCCGTEDDKLGCVTATCHVSKSPVPLDSQKGFVAAIHHEVETEMMGSRAWDMVGIDCEMVYTTHGNELARVTAVGIDGAVLYDVIVRPTHRVLDCNTRFSGLTFDDIEQATNTITDVQAVLLNFIRTNTIIIGHSLESDLIALRVRHDCVIDTSILYPHRQGPPKKRALKTLSGEVLQKVIQDNEAGHDSAEDAQIAVELVLAKLKSDLSSRP